MNNSTSHNNIADNTNRCPWCGNIVERAVERSLTKSEMQCPHCAHHYSVYYSKKQNFVRLTFFIAIYAMIKFDYVAGAVILLVLEVLLNELKIVRYPMSKCHDTIMPERGYRCTVKLTDKGDPSMLARNTVIPVVFVDENDKAVSSYCCVRVAEKKGPLFEKKDSEFICDLRLIAYGAVPEKESGRMILYNMGEKIGEGTVTELLEAEYR